MFALPLLATILLPLVHAGCYAPNGVLERNTAYQPCINVEGINSMCCALNRTIVGGVADKCTQNGLCVAADGTSWRGFCTDKNWASPGCLSNDICTDSTGGTSSNSNQLTKCQDGTYCCGDSTSCCSSNSGFTLNPTLISIKTATLQSSSSSSTSSTTSTSSPAPSSSSTECVPATAALAIAKGTSATLIGVGVGVPLAALAVIGSILGFWLGQKRGRRSHSAMMQKDDSGGNVGMISGDYKPYGEMKADVMNGNGNGHHSPLLMEQERPQELRGGMIQGPAELGSGMSR